MNMDIEDDFIDYPKNQLTFNMNSNIQNGVASHDYHYHSMYLNQNVQGQQVSYNGHYSEHNPNYYDHENNNMINQQYDECNLIQNQGDSLYYQHQNDYPQHMNSNQKEKPFQAISIHEPNDSKFNSDKIIDSQNQTSSPNNEENTSKNEKLAKKKKKKKMRTQVLDISPGPSLYEYQAYLLKGNVLLELNRNEDSRDYLPIGFKTNPYNAWKPIQRVVVHNNYNCIEIQVANVIKPQEDFSFIIDVLKSYGDSKYKDLSLSLSKYQSIIKQTKLLEQQFAEMSLNPQEIPKQNTNSKLPDKNKQIVNQEEYERAFFKQFYERAMEVLGSMNKKGENIFFAFTMGKFDKFGFYEDMFNFGVNKNFLLLLGSEMDQMSNAFLRNGWLEIFDYQTRIHNAFQFINLINDQYEKEMEEQVLKQSQNANFPNNKHQQASQQQAQQQSNTMKETVSEPVDIVVNTFDQIKVPAKMKIHDIKIKDFALRINLFDISPNMLQQVHAIRQKYINEKKSVNYIQMFDENFIYTTESQNFLLKFYPNHRSVQQNKNKYDPFEVLQSQEVRQQIEELRCGYRFLQ
ncbi:hypothetical protein ABPG74_015982 [Tetrahymena malaccensis]